MTLLLITSLLLAPAAVPFQEPVLVPETAAPTDVKADAAELKGRIHEMRMNLLTGGPKVRDAEREAVDFYGGKVELVERRLDSIRAELSEKRTSYDLALDRALSAGSTEQRSKAMGDASGLGAEITALEAEADNLTGKRGDLGKMIKAVESRDRERERLMAQLETTEGYELIGDLPMASVGLAPAVMSEATASHLDNNALVGDLLKRDPRAARKLLFESDPSGYWQRFPLTPPGEVMVHALEFPLPDLPGSR
jgi:hypothetical protein